MLETPRCWSALIRGYWAPAGELALEVPVWTGSALDAEVPALWLVHQLLSNPLWARNLEETLHRDGERAACYKTKGIFLPGGKFWAGRVPNSLIFSGLPFVKRKTHNFKLESKPMCYHVLCFPFIHPRSGGNENLTGEERSNHEGLSLLLSFQGVPFSSSPGFRTYDSLSRSDKQEWGAQHDPCWSFTISLAGEKEQKHTICLLQPLMLFPFCLFQTWQGPSGRVEHHSIAIAFCWDSLIWMPGLWSCEGRSLCPEFKTQISNSNQIPPQAVSVVSGSSQHISNTAQLI